jgi:hypothetical protein
LGRLATSIISYELERPTMGDKSKKEKDKNQKQKSTKQDQKSKATQDRNQKKS